MELLTGDRWMPAADGFREHTNPFSGTGDGCEWVYDHRQQTAAIRTPEDGNDAAMVTPPANTAPPQKLRPVRGSGKAPLDGQDQTQMPSASATLAGDLRRQPKLGFIGSGGFENTVGKKVVGAADDLGRVGSGPGLENRGPSSGSGSAWVDVSLSSSLDSVDDSSAGVGEPGKWKRKRKSRERLERFLENLVANMMEKQEQMHKQLIEMIEKKERERILREEAWKQQEIERMKKEEEARTQEMSRSLALISFIQSALGHEIELPKPLEIFTDQNRNRNDGDVQVRKEINGGNDNSYNRRWPEAEAQALITLRSALEDKFRFQKFSLSGAKGSIWDEISARMHEMGYNRTAKKCKEKWENMNKYYKKVTESGKEHQENSKTRSYFRELDNLYKNGFLNQWNAMVCSSNENDEKD